LSPWMSDPFALRKRCTVSAIFLALSAGVWRLVAHNVRARCGRVSTRIHEARSSQRDRDRQIEPNLEGDPGQPRADTRDQADRWLSAFLDHARVELGPSVQTWKQKHAR